MNKKSSSIAFYTENHYICEVNNLKKEGGAHEPL